VVEFLGSPWESPGVEPITPPNAEDGAEIRVLLYDTAQALDDPQQDDAWDSVASYTPSMIWGFLDAQHSFEKQLMERGIMDEDCHRPVMIKARLVMSNDPSECHQIRVAYV